MVQNAAQETEADETDSQMVVTSTTLPAPIEDLRFYEDADGMLFAEHEETGEITAITDVDDRVSFEPALVDTACDAISELDVSAPAPVQASDSELLSGGD